MNTILMAMLTILITIYKILMTMIAILAFDGIKASIIRLSIMYGAPLIYFLYCKYVLDRKTKAIKPGRILQFVTSKGYLLYPILPEASNLFFLFLFGDCVLVVVFINIMTFSYLLIPIYYAEYLETEKFVDVFDTVLYILFHKDTNND